VSGQAAYYIDKIALHNHSRLSDKVITSMLQVKAGQVQSNENLEAGIERINALGTFERITYQINQDKGQNVLEIEAGEKRWGPGYLDFNFAIEDDFQSRSNYSYGVAYTLTNLTPYGAEWRNEGIFGSWTHLSSELYAPFDAAQRFYGRVEGAYDKKERTVFFDNNPVWSSLTRSSSAESVRTNEGTWSTEAELGWNNRPWSQLALGNQWARSELSVDGVSGEETLYSWGPYLRYGYDTLNSRYFASEGTYLDSRLSYIRGWGGDVAEQDESWGLVSNLELIKPFALADRHTLSLRLARGGSDVSELLPIYLQDLGGLFNLSGYQRYQLAVATSCSVVSSTATACWTMTLVPLNRLSISAARLSGAISGRAAVPSSWVTCSMLAACLLARIPSSVLFTWPMVRLRAGRIVSTSFSVIPSACSGSGEPLSCGQEFLLPRKMVIVTGKFAGGFASGREAIFRRC